MHDETTTVGDRPERRAGDEAPRAPAGGRIRRPTAPRAPRPDPTADTIRRREVVVQGMRITLPALGFMDRPLPSPERKR